MLVHAVAPWLSAHIMLFRGNGCHKCATTLILWGQRQFLGIFRIQQVYMMCMRFFCTIHYLFPFSVQRTYSVAIIWPQEPNSCSWWTQHWKCEVRLSLSLSLNTRWKILEACVNADWEYFVDSVSEIKSILMAHGAVSRGCMYSAYPFLLWWLLEYVHFILLSSSNRKYDPFPIA